MLFRSSVLLSRLVRLAAVAALLIAAGVVPVAAEPDGAIDGFAGQPPAYLNCTLCHDSYPVNSGDGLIEILGLPSEFTSGSTYDLQVRLRDPGQIEWGFELTVLGPSDEQAGTLVVTDPVTTQLSDNSGSAPDYLKQTHAGTYEGTLDGPVTWPFQWVAPATGSVTFYLAGNAADANGELTNDWIYTLQAVVHEATVPVQNDTWTRVKQLYAKGR